jgi:hypothetical protein
VEVDDGGQHLAKACQRARLARLVAVTITLLIVVFRLGAQLRLRVVLRLAISGNYNVYDAVNQYNLDIPFSSLE